MCNNLNYITTLSFICWSVVAVPKFRILAPQVICPNHGNTSYDKLDYSVITIQPKSITDFQLSWVLRWVPLPSPSQRVTLNLWKLIRDLEKKFNTQSENELDYIIKKNELLSGVTYIFNVTAKSTEGVAIKSFNIIYEDEIETAKAVQILPDEFSVILLGTQTTYNDLQYILVADVTTCTDAQDYYFSWSVSNMSDHSVSHIKGSRLEIPAYTLKPGVTYVVNCEIKTVNSDVFIKDRALTFSVLRRKLQVYLNVDELMVAINEAFTMEAFIIPNDLSDQMKFEWSCTSEEKVCDFFENGNERVYNFSQGIPEEGKYKIYLTVTVLQEVAETNATINAVNGILPILQIQSINRVVNKNREVYLVGRASNLAPSCDLTWYFATAEYLASESTFPVNDSGNEFSHGTPISDPIKLNSIEENFLYEYVDFTNETHTRQIEARIPANNGRARLVAECNCSISFECETDGAIYGDLHLVLNESPNIYNFSVYPESGLALDSLFRIWASASDPDVPLRFTFYYVLDNQTILLASHLDHAAIETYLPYIVGGTDVLVEVCDSLDACSRSEFINVKVYHSDADIDKLVDKVTAHVRRCEIIELTHTSVSTMISLLNSQRWEQLTIFTGTLLETLPALRSNCSLSEVHYAEVMSQLAAAGLDTTPLFG